VRQLVFEQEYGTAVRDGQRGPPATGGGGALGGQKPASPGAWGTPQSVFPSFSGSAGKASTLGSLSFHNQGAPYSSVGLGGLGAAGPMGFAGGVPVVLVDNATRRSLVLSPLDAFLSTTFAVAADPKVKFTGLTQNPQVDPAV
jgi:hypothetical protein